MTENHEFNAATIEEAVEKASQKLGLNKDELSYEVLDTGSSGFLGMGSRDARISVTSGVQPQEPSTESEAEPPEVEAAEDENGGGSPVSSNTQDADIDSSRDLPDEDHPEASEDLLKEIEEFVNQSVRVMGLDARVDVYDAESFIAVDVTSDEAGLFIGQKGETIDAFQYLLNVAVYRDRPYVKRIIVDSEGYRQRRVEAVQGIAHRMARKATREGRSVELPPMNTSERRVVHLFLRDNTQVSTASQGNGENRRVTVSPT